jgi:hypothetical protein
MTKSPSEIAFLLDLIPPTIYLSALGDSLVGAIGYRRTPSPIALLYCSPSKSAFTSGTDVASAQFTSGLSASECWEAEGGPSVASHL